MKLIEKLKKDIKEFETTEKSKGIENVYNHAHQVAIINELESLIDSHCEDDEEGFEESYKELLKYKGNVCEGIIEYYSNFRHPERYNPFISEGLTEVIELFIKEELGVKNENIIHI